MSAIEKITELQKGIENTPAWMVGEQLKDICREEPDSAELVEKDLEGKGMGLTDCAAKIKAWADKQKRTGNCVCVPPQVAEGIIREFYGLPGKSERTPADDLIARAQEDDGMLDLSAFL